MIIVYCVRILQAVNAVQIDGVKMMECPLCGTMQALPDTTWLHGLGDVLVAIEPLLSCHDTTPVDDENAESGVSHILDIILAFVYSSCCSSMALHYLA